MVFAKMLAVSVIAPELPLAQQMPAGEVAALEPQVLAALKPLVHAQALSG